MLQYEQNEGPVAHKETRLQYWAKKIATRGMGIVFSAIVIIMLVVAIVLETSVGRGFHAVIFALGAVVLSSSLALNTILPRTRANYITGSVGIVVTAAVLVSCISFFVGWFAKNVETLSMGLAFFISLFMFFVSLAWTIINLMPPTPKQIASNQVSTQQNQILTIGDEAPPPQAVDRFPKSTKVLNVVVALLWIAFAIVMVIFSLESVSSVSDFYKYTPPDEELIPIGNGSFPTEVTFSPTTFSPTSLSPSETPTNSPTIKPSASPTFTFAPSKSPSQSPSNSPSANPTVSPSLNPTNMPTRSPSAHPTYSPSNSPTNLPTTAPTSKPTDSPSTSPTKMPTRTPTTSPTDLPSLSPTNSPTTTPTNSPTKSPTASPSKSPSKSPSVSPTKSPSESPTTSPTNPTNSPSKSPSIFPTLDPTTANPSKSPSKAPVTENPTKTPVTEIPTNTPTTFSPSKAPSTVSPSKAPTTKSPSNAPVTASPSNDPTKKPTTKSPSRTPTTISPSRTPTTKSPSKTPTTISPTKKPTTLSPTKKPTTSTPTTGRPTTSAPTLKPTFAPTTLRPTSPTPPTSSPTTIVEDENRVPHKIQIKCAGSEAALPPYVLFDATIGGTHLDWTWVQRILAEAGIRSCAYSRSGLSYSQQGLHPRSAKIMAVELADLVSYLGFDRYENGLILVAQGTGSHTARVYRALYGNKVIKGFVFVNGIDPSEVYDCDADASPVYDSVILYNAFTCSLGWNRLRTWFGETLFLENPFISSLPEDVRNSAKYAYTACTWYDTVAEEDAYRGISCGEAELYDNVQFYQPLIQLISEYTYDYYGQYVKKDDAKPKKLAEKSKNGSVKTIPDSVEVSAIMVYETAKIVAEEIISLYKR